jgi:hypothetical protein
VDKQKKTTTFLRGKHHQKKLWPGKIPKTKYSASCKTIQILFGKPDQITQQELYCN